MTINTDEARQILNRIDVYVAPAEEDSDALAVWSYGAGEPFIVRRLSKGWWADDLAMWAITHLRQLLDEYDLLLAANGGVLPDRRDPHRGDRRRHDIE
jgi:hypothetical protein